MGVAVLNRATVRAALLLLVVLVLTIFHPACGGSSPSAPTPSVQACDAGFTVYPQSPPVAGLAWVTSFRFKSVASCTGYGWNFGDGATATDAVVYHTFNSAGQFTVTHTATNSAGAATTTQQVMVKEMTGVWIGTIATDPVVTFTLTVTQSGASATATYVDNRLASGTIPHVYLVDGRNRDDASTHPGVFMDGYLYLAGRQINLRGDAADDLNSFTGGSNYDGPSAWAVMKMTRQ